MKPRVFVLVVLAVPSPTLLAGDLSGALRNCTGISDAEKRLECYDTLAAAERQPQPNPDESDPVSAGGQWKLTRETSPIDDSRVVYLSLAASQTSPLAPGRSDPTLFIRCKNGAIECFLNWGTPVGTRDVDLTTRLDEESAETKRWTLSTDFTSTFFRGSSPAFVAKLRNHKRLVVRISPLYQNETTAIFDLFGLEAVVGEVLGACKSK